MQLNYRRYGNGEPLIVLHGLFGSLDNWHSFSERMAGRFTVYAVDQRNHGGSPKSPEMNYRAMAADLAELMENLGIFQASVLGHSMGGKTAMQFALNYPGRVRKLVVADISPRAYEPRHQFILDALLKLDPAQYASRQQMDAALAGAIPEAPVRQFLLKSVAREPGGPFRWKLGVREIHQNYASLLERISGAPAFDGPALFIRGELSDYLPESDRPLIRQIFPRAEFDSVARAGHWLHVENAEGFVSKVSEFLQR